MTCTLLTLGAYAATFFMTPGIYFVKIITEKGIVYLMGLTTKKEGEIAFLFKKEKRHFLFKKEKYFLITKIS